MEEINIDGVVKREDGIEYNVEDVFKGSYYINRAEYIIYFKMAIYGLLFYILNTVDIGKRINKDIESIFINIIIFVLIIYIMEKTLYK